MELVECIERRTSVRSFTDEPVQDDLIVEAIRLGNLAPSAGNLQARDFIVVRDRETRRKLVQAANGQRFLEEAPVVIVCCSNLERIGSYGHRGRDLYCLQDVAASVENMLLFFIDRGYASFWVGAFDESMVSKTLSLPRHVRPVAMLPVGKPREQIRHQSRMKMEALIHRERW